MNDVVTIFEWDDSRIVRAMSNRAVRDRTGEMWKTAALYRSITITEGTPQVVFLYERDSDEGQFLWLISFVVWKANPVFPWRISPQVKDRTRFGRTVDFERMAWFFIEALDMSTLKVNVEVKPPMRRVPHPIPRDRFESLKKHASYDQVQKWIDMWNREPDRTRLRLFLQPLRLALHAWWKWLAYEMGIANSVLTLEGWASTPFPYIIGGPVGLDDQGVLHMRMNDEPLEVKILEGEHPIDALLAGRLWVIEEEVDAWIEAHAIPPDRAPFAEMDELRLLLDEHPVWMMPTDEFKAVVSEIG